jgi:hypothetical protein
MPFTRSADLAVSEHGVFISLTTPGSGAPNYGIDLTWLEVTAVAVVVGSKSTELRILFDGPEGETLVTFKAKNARTLDCAKELKRYCNPETFFVQ